VRQRENKFRRKPG